MYITSKMLLDRIKKISDEIYHKSNGTIVFEEYITLPFYENIILRFDITIENYSLADLDTYEKMMTECAQNAFLIDFMGSVYKKVGLNMQELKSILMKCRDKYCEEIITSSIHASQIKEDTIALLDLCGLSKELKVWEIQLEEEVNLLVLGNEFKKLGNYSSENYLINVYEVNELECEGLMKATMFAKNNHISLVRALLEA